VPTTRPIPHGIADPSLELQVDTLARNSDPPTASPQFKMNDTASQGIVQVIGPEQGATCPADGRSAATQPHVHARRFGALAHGIWHQPRVEATCSRRRRCCASKAKNMLIKRRGATRFGVGAKDIRRSRSSARSVPPAGTGLHDRVRLVSAIPCV
jgi:3-isopropylmalate/(R)-2-methylmalate dehydratase large subunit